ncbi:uncharacterized protein B0H64DRAFT_411794 [Chaetomium fimeti]|uniref:Uncharacterized protein n=1 Tax=Chaetomium fimeti TaxID=1854472 RepID=A0AAE0H648_9PEZI|nr:hypothetical protein B0H64DRAFT_411794 [Chaetomium fimeti]
MRWMSLSEWHMRRCGASTLGTRRKLRICDGSWIRGTSTRDFQPPSPIFSPRFMPGREGSGSARVDGKGWEVHMAEKRWTLNVDVVCICSISFVDFFSSISFTRSSFPLLESSCTPRVRDLLVHLFLSLKVSCYLSSPCRLPATRRPCYPTRRELNNPAMNFW